MADISKITLGSTTYNIKDAVARAVTAGAIVLRGETSTALADMATTNPITINGDSYTAIANDAVFYDHKEFVFDGTNWHEFGDMTGLGDLAEYDTVSVSTNATTDAATTVSAAESGDATYTPAGTISGTAIAYGSGESWDAIKAEVGTGQDAETLIISAASEPSVTDGSFTGTGARLVTGSISVPSTYSVTLGNNA